MRSSDADSQDTFSQPDGPAGEQGEAMSSLTPQVVSEARLAMVAGVGPLIRKRLVDQFGSAAEVLGADTHALQRVEGVGPKLASAVHKAPSQDNVLGLLREAASAGIYPVTIGSEAYPPLLKELHDSPPVLYVRGAIQPVDRRAIAIVGTRHATRYGLRHAAALAEGLVRAGYTIVSGLARGIDAAAHRAALDAGGRTLAVLGGGLLKLYPPEHGPLADDIARAGAVLAEAPPHQPPRSGSFPQRNRIICGLSLGTIVIEAAERSGALITAHHAVEQGREVFALPGPIDSAHSRGCHRLIQTGAKLVTTVDDVLEELDAIRLAVEADEVPQQRSHEGTDSQDEGKRAASKRPERARSGDEQLVLDAVAARGEAVAIDLVVDQIGLPVQRVLVAISMLEAAGELRRVSGSTVEAV